VVRASLSHGGLGEIAAWWRWGASSTARGMEPSRNAKNVVGCLVAN